MKNIFKKILIIFMIVITLILLDTLQARILKRSPLISFKEKLDSDSYVDRGIIIDTFYCVKEKDIVTVSWHFKTSKFTCPKENISKINNYDFSVVSNETSEYKKIFAFEYQDVNYYYGNKNFTLYIKDQDNKYDIEIEDALTRNMVDFNDILNKNIKIDTALDGSKIYHYDTFNIIVCSAVDGVNDVIIGNNELEFKDFCKSNLGEEEGYVTTGTADYLYNMKPLGIKDSSRINKLLGTLDLGTYGDYTFETKNTNNTNILVINYSQINSRGILEKSDIVTEKSAILMALIEDLDEINWKVSDDTKKINVSDLNEQFGNIKEYGKSIQNMKTLLIKLGYYEKDEPITMNVKDLTNKGLTLSITNHTNDKYLYGNSFTVEKKEKGKWVLVDGMPNFFTAIGLFLLPKSTKDEKYSWDVNLTSGLYRIVVDFDHIISERDSGFEFGKKHIILSEFTIE